MSGGPIRNIRDGLKVAAQQQNLLDKVITWFAPERGVTRMKARTRLALAGGYSGASRSKRALSAWRPGSGSADADTLPDLPELRDRSSDLVRNSPLAGGAINTVCTNVVGTGLMLKSQVDRVILGWDEEQASAWQRLAEREFALWAESTFCDVTRTQNFYGLQDLACRSALEKGDVLALLPMIERRGTPYRLCVQLVEADRVSNANYKRDTRALAGGIELDEYGAPMAAWISDRHPGDIDRTGQKWRRVPMFGERTGRRNVLHLYTKLRVGQTRGVPYLAPVVELLKQMTRYTEAELFAAVLTSMVALVFKTDGEGPSPLESAVDGNTPAAGGSDAAASSWNGELSAGLTVEIDEGQEVSSMASARPNTAFDPFILALSRQVGVQLELPYEILIKHFTASYSAARAALLEAWKFYRRRRAWLAAYFCQPVYEAWMDEAVSRGRLSAPGYFRDPLLRMAYLGSAWHGDGPGSIDPMKEANAAEKRLSINLRTLAQEIAEDSGQDMETVIEGRVREEALVKRLRERAGLSAPAVAPPNADAAPDDAPDDEDDAEPAGDDTEAGDLETQTT